MERREKEEHNKSSWENGRQGKQAELEKEESNKKLKRKMEMKSEINLSKKGPERMRCS